jgi:hypothetical protein
MFFVNLFDYFITPLYPKIFEIKFAKQVFVMTSCLSRRTRAAFSFEIIPVVANEWNYKWSSMNSLLSREARAEGYLFVQHCFAY